MAERNTPYDVINSYYKKRCPVLPEKLKHKETNDVLAFMVQRLPFKASMKHVGGCRNDKI